MTDRRNCKIIQDLYKKLTQNEKNKIFNKIKSEFKELSKNEFANYFIAVLIGENDNEKINFNKVQICVRPSNLPSKKVIDKCGFTYEGTLREYFFRNGKYEDRMYHSILRKEF